MDPRSQQFHMPPNMMPPPVVNQPPRIFGAFPPDQQMVVPQFPPELSAGGLFQDQQTDDLTDQKRRRIARACDMCRKKKIKCDGKMPACSHCLNYKTPCVFTQVEKKRTPPKGAKYIEGLENRLNRMESLLRLSGLLEDDDGSTDLGELEKKLAERFNRERKTSQSASGISSHASPADFSQNGDAKTASSTPHTSLDSPEPTATLSPTNSHQAAINNVATKKTPVQSEPTAEKHEEVEALSEMMCSLVTNQDGATNYIGSSSSYSIFSPKGIEWVKEKTGDDSFQRMISDVSIDDHKWSTWKPEVFGDLFPRPIFRPLPSKPEAMSLLNDFFENFNCMTPLFHGPTFMVLAERHYSGNPYRGAGWWASLNVALAIATRIRVMSGLVPPSDDDIGWGYLKNALSVFSELVMRNADLLSVQALLGMALFMQGTPNPQPNTLLITTAIKLSHSIGLHKKGTGFNLNPIEIEQRKRVFWIAYTLDKHSSLLSGRPPAQDDDDINVELPDNDPQDNVGNVPMADGKGKMNLFRVVSEFAVIEGKVYKKLYSNKATKQTDGEYLNVIGELDQELEEWKDRIPIDFRPEHDIKASHTPMILHVVMLHFSYYHCLTTIHRMAIHHGYWTSRLSNYALQGLNSKPINPRIFSSAALCTAAARATISLIKYLPPGDNACVWMSLYFPVSALMTLFGNILQNPLDARAKSDTQLMAVVVSFLSMLGPEAESGGVHRMLGVCSEFERIAKKVIEKAEKENAGRRKRKSHSASSAPSTTGTGASTVPSVAKMEAVPEQQILANEMQQGFHGVVPPQHAPPNVSMPMTSLGPEMAYTQVTMPPQNLMDAISPMSAGWPSEFPNIIDANGNFNYEGIMSHMGNQLGDQMVMGGDGYGPNGQMPVGGFQQPLLPQDLYSLPVGLDWDWAEMSGGAYPTVENGNFMPMSG